MQRYGQVRVILEDVKKRAVAILIGGFKDAVKIADRLVVVQHDDQSKIRAHGNHPGDCWQRRLRLWAVFDEGLSGIYRSYRKVNECVYASGAKKGRNSWTSQFIARSRVYRVACFHGAAV